MSNIEKNSLIMDKPLHQCTDIVKGSICVLDPRASLFLIGIAGLCSSGGGDYSIIGDAAYFLCILASPVYEPARLILGGGLLIGGSIGAAIIAPIWGGEWLTRKIRNILIRQPNPNKQRKEIAALFCKRMYDVYGKIPNLKLSQQQALMADPTPLIALSTLMVAFNSRREESGKLRLHSGKKIALTDIPESDIFLREYFRDINNISQSVKRFNLPSNDTQALQSLADIIQPLCDYSLEDAATDLPDNIKDLIDFSFVLADRISSDIDFQAAWAELRESKAL